jgi:hypothetical protein
MIATYADLVSTIGDWLDRDDLSTRAGTFIQMVEARVNRLLSDPDMELSVTLTGDGASLPADYGEMVSLGTSDGNPLIPIGNEEYAAILPEAGTSRYYTIREGKVYYAPGSANPTLVYRRGVPALTATNATNWLLVRAPDVYLYGSLLEASDLTDEPPETVQKWALKYQTAIQELVDDGQRRKWGAGPLSPRIRRT